ncbi:glycerol-3-phosphate dehydrogenase/oxidase [Gleimia sp. 6138-11-ORH1]|uniref:glycerol-3-phosphate dehydrogenase/oxidase n=1 Tax=Gleimia sp. 6138-11-ORH1 TaxID=2973937 RepID=UPI002169556E|nr:glycerol-3-phosphate dehydrogenase/oxidase [Gleimia sp. 6138-11-ORH1]MCS4485159.1 glycerol-3-phosphate dehydrogenase/oxidase [Gleimia sp. 6138-11-ORH1]
MSEATMNAQTRQEALEAMTEGVDILVIGGGVTGAGIVYDAALRGLKTGIIDAQDWSAGTSSRSSKLVHGGLRYLYQMNFKLVHEALTERGLLLESTAPHLVKKMPLLWPFKTPLIERTYSTAGVGLYDVMAQIAHRGSVPIQKHYSKKGALELVPDLHQDSLIGAMVYYDARVDDSRLVLNLVRSAVDYGAYAANRTQVVAMGKENGRVVSATVRDLETGKEYVIPTKKIINATGVWTEETEKLGDSDGGLKVLASKGIHIVVPKDRINGKVGMFVRTEKSVLFIIPWKRYWIIGTTDTKYVEDFRHPVANASDVDYVLEQANQVLARPLTRDDIIGYYAGLRPLLQPGTKNGDTKSTKVSREHTVTEAAPGLVIIAGGKLTTYRVMAEDAVNFALGKAEAKRNPSLTATTPLRGAHGYRGLWNQRKALAKKSGLSVDHIEDLLDRYGDDIHLIFKAIEQDPSLGKELAEANEYLRAEIAFGVTHEGALHLEDMMCHRTRLTYERRDRGLAAVPEIADIMAGLLGWDDAKREAEIAAYQARCDAEEAALQVRDEAESQAVRGRHGDVTPMDKVS